MDNTYQKNCRLCLRLFAYCKPELVEIDSLRQLYKVCWKYLRSDKNIPLKWNDLWKEGNPLCNDCQHSSGKLLALNESLIAMKRDIKKLISEFTEEIHKYRSEASFNGIEVDSGWTTDVKEEEQNGPVERCTDLDANERFINENMEDLFDGHYEDSDECMNDNGVDWSPDENIDDLDGLFNEELTQLTGSESANVKPKLEEKRRNSKYHLRNKSEVTERFYTEEEIISDPEESADGRSSPEYVPVKIKEKRVLQKKNVGKPRGKYKKRRKPGEKPPPKSKTCEICNLTFGTARSAATHSRIHKFQTWECEICEKTFYSVALSKPKHMRLCHPEKEIADVELKCDKCNETFNSTYLFEIHNLDHKGEIPFTCRKCSKCFSTFQTYIDHCRYTSCASNGIPDSVKVNTCSTCNETFYAKFALWIHELDHSNPDRMAFYCKICGKTLRTTFLAEKHFISHTEEKPYPCDICGKPYGYSYSLELHRKSHKAIEHCEYKCEECNLIFLNRNNLTLHKRVHKINENKGEAKESAQFPCTNCDQRFTCEYLLKVHTKSHIEASKCDLCEKSFENQRDLNKHMSLRHNKGTPQFGTSFKLAKLKPGTRTKSRKRNAETEDKTEKEDEEGEFCCDKCGEVFNGKLAYRRHLRNRKHGKRYWDKYSNYGEKPPYPCVNCKEEFLDRKKIRFHYSTHPACKDVFYETKQKRHKYQCKMCDYRAPGLYYLKLHTRGHTGEKPYQCDSCGMSFSRKDKLNIHIERNGGTCDSRPYCCKFCPTKCDNITQIKEHYNLNPECKNKLDATKRYPCETCGKRLESYKRLLIHMRVHNITSDEAGQPQPYTCATCGKNFSSSRYLNQHRSIHSGQSQTSEVVPLVMQPL